MAEENINKPIESKQFDRVQAAIWRQEGGGDGKTPFHTITLSRSFKGEDGQWRRVHSFTARDLPHLGLAVEWALRELLLKPE